MREPSRKCAADGADPFRPRMGLLRVPLPALAGITACVVTLAIVAPSGPLASRHRRRAPEASSHAARTAIETMVQAERLLRQARLEEGVLTPPEAGPGAPAFIGDEITPLVTTLGSLEAKRLAGNPLWAGALAERLAERGIGPGSFVAAGFSGSFPGLNVAVVAACQALGADVAAVSSVTASTWGANQPGFTWPEMEQRLVAAGIIRPVSIAVTIGGSEDRGDDLDADGRSLAAGIMERTASALGAIALLPDDYQSAIERRLELYDRARAGRPVALYVNVGGTDPSLGRSPAVLRQGSGFLPGIPFDLSRERGIVARYAERGVPVLMLLNIRPLALAWGIPLGGSSNGQPPREGADLRPGETVQTTWKTGRRNECTDRCSPCTPTCAGWSSSSAWL